LIVDGRGRVPLYTDLKKSGEAIYTWLVQLCPVLLHVKATGVATVTPRVNLRDPRERVIQQVSYPRPTVKLSLTWIITVSILTTAVEVYPDESPKCPEYSLLRVSDTEKAKLKNPASWNIAAAQSLLGQQYWTNSSDMNRSVFDPSRIACAKAFE
jgi:hypothetical protein